MMTRLDDLTRELDKIQDTLNLCLLNLGKQSESWAALHCNDNVMYSPLYSRVGAALTDVAALRFQLEALFAELSTPAETADA